MSRTEVIALWLPGDPRKMRRPDPIPARRGAHLALRNDPTYAAWLASWTPVVRLKARAQGVVDPPYWLEVVVVRAPTQSLPKRLYGTVCDAPPDGDRILHAASDLLQAAGVIDNDVHVVRWVGEKVWGYAARDAGVWIGLRRYAFEPRLEPELRALRGAS